MIIALQLGRGGSVGFPGKNTHEVLGRPLMEYPLLAVKNSKYVDDVYVSTDSEEIKSIARKNGVKVIDRPDYLCTKEALHEDAMVHGYRYVRNGVADEIEMIVLIQCNAPFVLTKHIDEGIEKLREDKSFDSAVTVSKYNMYTPARARRVDENGVISNVIPFDDFTEASKVTCDKDSSGDVYFADGLFIVRPKCLEYIEDGMPPYRWMGQKSYAIQNWAGLDVDYAWQIPQVEYWLKENGFTEGKIPYDAKTFGEYKIDGKKEMDKNVECQGKVVRGGTDARHLADDRKHFHIGDPVRCGVRLDHHRHGAHGDRCGRCA